MDIEWNLMLTLERLGMCKVVWPKNDKWLRGYSVEEAS